MDIRIIYKKKSEGRSLEDIAEGYWENHIERNLVMVTQRAISDGKDQTTKAVYSHKQHAHLAFTEMDNLVEWSVSCSLVGSVLFKNYDPHFARRPLSSPAFSISHILLNFKFLKVLELEHQVVIDFIPTELPYLRYFSALIDQNSIPSSISNLWNLETLILKRRSAWRNNMLLLPGTVWDMYHVLNFPIRLEILKLYRSKASKTIPFCISAPNLKYLKLSGFYLHSQYLSETVDHLKHLEVLKLYNVEFGDYRE
ncbi:hypothetical protein H5410_025591 [Solanum commersonii]|uniref:Disease resistance protein n=1 Tax=Solanum commersonii TaxID=4109 RepID=A0A9J5YTK2_SOLCO|nr:hypothetical protein H5410_025591 [Solanum commersonii]